MDDAAPRVIIARDRTGHLGAAEAVDWAVGELRDAVHAAGARVELLDMATAAPSDGDGLLVQVSGADTATARQIAQAHGVILPTDADSLALVPGEIGGRDLLLATGPDARGLVYAVLELADRVRHADRVSQALEIDAPIVERPASPIRGIAKLQVSEVEDLPWFYDREGWRRYLTMLATQRFNRLHLAFGIGHDFLRNVLDAYLLFPYPFLVAVPGYDVRAIRAADGAALPAEERERNLDTLRFVSAEAGRRGIHFQLGIWTQQYRWTDSPNATYTIEGLNEENHAAYCRDALQAVLDACPDIAGVTLRVHGESGVPEGNYDFWRVVFGGIAAAGRRVELDLHPKGVDRTMIDVALAAGLPVMISPKYTAEHLGLPGHQAAIRPTERDPRGREGDAFVEGLMNRSAFDLSYTRYGYADFLEEGRPYGVYYRIWPGTQRLLLWGSPELAAGLGREGTLAGSLGVEVMEPLSFKGRRGSGLPGGRTAYADASLAPARDWEKYAYTFRLFGRLLYNPDAAPETWCRQLSHEFGPAANAVEQALASAGRILPLITTAHHPSAANNRYWPEIYTNMPIVDERRPHPYLDTVEPKRFGTVSPHDPAMFSSIEDFADGIVRGEADGRYSPLRVATWLEQSADAAIRALEQAEWQAVAPQRPAFRRLAVDVLIQAGLGQFFAGKLRAGVAYALFTRSGARGYLVEGVEAYRAARAAWARLAEQARVYRDDVTVGGEPWLRGHWTDRLAAIDDDLNDMEHALETAPGVDGAVSLASLDPAPPNYSYEHTPPASFAPGAAVSIEVAVRLDDGADASVRLHYRHLNQAEAYQIVEMAADADRFRANIPGAYTASPYQLLYFFEVRSGPRQAGLMPGLDTTLANRPYYVVRQSSPTIE